MGKKWKVKKGKKKGKKWVEKNRSNKKGEKKGKQKKHQCKRKTHLFPYVPKAEGLLNFLRLHIYMIHPHLPSRKNLPNKCSSRKRVPSANLLNQSIPQEDSKQLASAQGCRRLALQHRVSSKRALRHPAGTLWEVARRFGRSPLGLPKTGKLVWVPNFQGKGIIQESSNVIHKMGSYLESG